MSTNVQVNVEDVGATRFNGGARGVCVCLTRRVEGQWEREQVSFTRDEARAVAETLMAFAEGNEVEVFE